MTNNEKFQQLRFEYSKTKYLNLYTVKKLIENAEPFALCNNRLSELTGLHKATIGIYTKTLVEAGIIEVEKKRFINMYCDRTFRNVYAMKPE